MWQDYVDFDLCHVQDSPLRARRIKTHKAYSRDEQARDDDAHTACDALHINQY